MRHTWSVSVMCALLAAGPALAAEMPVQSSVSTVTVYPGTARVTRQAKVTLPPGSHSLVFDNIVPHFDEQSLSVTGEGTASVKILGAYIKVEEQAQVSDEKVQGLLNQIQGVNDKLAAAQQALKVLSQEREFIQSVKFQSGQQIPEDLITKMPSVEELNGLYQFIGDSLRQLAAREQEAQTTIRSYQEELNKLQRELSALQGGYAPKSERLVVVDVECSKAGSLEVDLSYVVHGATWRPIYDARVNPDTGKIELTTYGAVRQSTGEIWDKAFLTLSTAQPMIGGNLPYVDPWIVSEMPVHTGKARMAMKASMESAVRQDMGYQTAAFDAPMGAEELKKEADLSYAQTDFQGVSAVYTIARPVSIAADGQDNKFPLNRQELSADLYYAAYPRRSPYAYLGSRVKNAADVQLLPGEANLFLGEQYVGRSYLEHVAPGEEFDFYLGADENVKVKKDEISRRIDDVLIGGIPAPSKKTIITYQLSVENHSQRDTKIRLFDAVPVSQSDKIKVKISDVSLAPTEKDWEERQGVWLWELNLAKNAKKIIQYTVVVEHPRDLVLNGF